MAKNYYDTLGVAKDASEKDIRSAYRRLARKYHPDVNPGDAAAEAHFKEINEAYQVLADSDSRKKYDQFGANWRSADQFQHAGNSGASPFTWFTRARRRGGRGGEETFEADPSLFGDFGNLFGDLLGRSRGPEQPTRQQVEVPVTVTLEEAYAGAKRTVQSPPDPMTGKPGKRLEVAIPVGVDSGSRVHIGTPAKGGGGVDLYLKVNIAGHKVFEREGDDLHVGVDVPLVDAMLGGEVEVPTITGKRVALKVPPETQNGRIFRLKGKGMPRKRRGAGTSHGDLLAAVKVVLPDELNDEQRELFLRLRDLRGASA